MAQLLADAIFQRASTSSTPGPPDPYAGHPAGRRRSRRSSNAGHRLSAGMAYVIYAAIVGPDGRRSSTARRRSVEGSEVAEQEDFASLVDGGALDAARAPSISDRRFEVREPILAGETSRSATIRVGVSTLLVANELRTVADARAASTALIALVVSTLVATLLVAVDAAADSRHPERPDPPGPRRARRARSICPGEEFRDLGSSFDAISAQLSAVRTTGAAGVGHRLRVGDGQPRGRGGAVLAAKAS